MLELRYLNAMQSTAAPQVKDRPKARSVVDRGASRSVPPILGWLDRRTGIQAGELPATYARITLSGSATLTTGIYNPVPPAFPAMSEHLLRLAELRADWNGQASDPPNDLAIRRASSIAQWLATTGLEPSRIVASAAGGVTFYFFNERAPQRVASIDCLNTGERVAMLSDRTSDAPEIWEIEDSIVFSETLARVRRFVSHASSPR